MRASTLQFRRKQVALLLRCLDDLAGTPAPEEEEEEAATDGDQPADDNQPVPMEEAA